MQNVFVFEKNAVHRQKKRRIEGEAPFLHPREMGFNPSNLILSHKSAK